MKDKDLKIKSLLIAAGASAFFYVFVFKYELLLDFLPYKYQYAKGIAPTPWKASELIPRIIGGLLVLWIAFLVVRDDFSGRGKKKKMKKKTPPC